MSWWGYAFLSAGCWGLQYMLLEVLFEKADFAPVFSFLSLANGVLVAFILFVLHPAQDWTQLWRTKEMIKLSVLYLLAGSGAYLFNALAISGKNATLASLLEISYPAFIILFTAIFLRKFHLNLTGGIGACLILGGCVLVAVSKSN